MVLILCVISLMLFMVILDNDHSFANKFVCTLLFLFALFSYSNLEKDKTNESADQEIVEVQSNKETKWKDNFENTFDSISGVTVKESDKNYDANDLIELPTVEKITEILSNDTVQTKDRMLAIEHINGSLALVRLTNGEEIKSKEDVYKSLVNSREETERDIDFVLADINDYVVLDSYDPYRALFYFASDETKEILLSLEYLLQKGIYFLFLIAGGYFTGKYFKGLFDSYNKKRKDVEQRLAELEYQIKAVKSLKKELKAVKLYNKRKENNLEIEME